MKKTHLHNNNKRKYYEVISYINDVVASQYDKVYKNNLLISQEISLRPSNDLTEDFDIISLKYEVDSNGNLISELEKIEILTWKLRHTNIKNLNTEVLIMKNKKVIFFLGILAGCIIYFIIN